MVTKLCRDVLPDHSIADKDFRESSFFSVAGRQLPDPSTLQHLKERVFEHPRLTNLSGAPVISDTVHLWRQVTIYSDLQLVVKYGSKITIDEAITMLAIRNVFGGQIPVLEVYGWRTRGNVVYIYMELILGVTMKERLEDPDFSHHDQEIIRYELTSMIKQLRQLKQEDTSIGSIIRAQLTDRCFDDTPPAGPFETLRAFYDWMQWLSQRFMEPSQRFPDPYLALMPKDSSIVFTHADLHPTNIIVTKPTTSPPRVLAIIDWGQSGWYPDYWEYFKMCYTTRWDGQWRKEWVEKIVDVRQDEEEIMAEFTMGFGAL